MPTVTPSTDVPPPKFSVLAFQLLLQPWKIIRLWNWKAALLSIFLRGPIFLAVGFSRGLVTAIGALATETFFCAATAGFYGAMVQFLRLAEPQWLTLLFITLILPAAFQGLEYALHVVRATPHLRIAEIVSIGVSGISALFNWYLMRRNTLLVGGEGERFTGDLARLPALFLSFLLAGPRRWLSRVNTRKMA